MIGLIFGVISSIKYKLRNSVICINILFNMLLVMMFLAVLMAIIQWIGWIDFWGWIRWIGWFHHNNDVEIENSELFTDAVASDVLQLIMKGLLWN